MGRGNQPQALGKGASSMRAFRIVLTSAFMTAAMLATSARVQAQQQWGPPQQSLYNHNPGSAPTYVRQSTYIPSVTVAHSSTLAAAPHKQSAHTTRARVATHKLMLAHSTGGR
jgi:hypothetical protein